MKVATERKKALSLSRASITIALAALPHERPADLGDGNVLAEQRSFAEPC
jgi:hypothetical protein